MLSHQLLLTQPRSLLGLLGQMECTARGSKKSTTKGSVWGD